MLSFAKNERGFRMASVAILLLPFVSLVYMNSRSSVLDLVLLIGYLIFASVSIIAFLYEKAEEEDSGKGN